MSKRIIRWPLAAIGAMILSGLLAACVINGERALELVRSQEEQSARQLAAQQALVKDLKNQKEIANSSGYIKAKARQYGFIMPGELCFEISNADLLPNYTEAEVQTYMDEKKR